MSTPERPANGDRATNGATIRALWSDEKHVAEETMHALLDGELSDEDKHAVASHIESCVRCSREHSGVEELRAAVARTLTAWQPHNSSTATTPATIRRNARRTPSAHPRPLRRSPPAIDAIAEPATRNAAIRTRTLGRRTRAVLGISIGLAVAAGGAIYALSHRTARTHEQTTTSLADTSKSVAVQMAAPSGPPSKTANPDTARIEMPPLPTPTPYTVSGTVVSPSASNAKLVIGGAQVFIPGTNIATTTDASGGFTLRNVPGSATKIEARHAIGFMGGNTTIALHNNAFANVTVAVRPSVVSLNSIQANDAGALDIVSTPNCLVAVARISKDHPRIFTALRGSVANAGVYRLDVIDWPTSGKITNAAFALEVDGVLHGSAKAANARLGLVLTRRGDRWMGTVSEERIGSSRSEPMVLQPETNASRCGS